MKLTHIGLFEGIGGFSIAAEVVGWETVAWCEWNPYCQGVLKARFPNAEGFGDITKTDFKKYANTIDILTGGFPCQPYSMAGKRLGKDDERHLWPEMLRAIREIQPRWVVGENVRGIISWNGGMVFDEVQSDLETAGYEVLPFLLPACAVNAPHRRDRVWFVAYRTDAGLEGAAGARLQGGSVGFAQCNDRTSQNPNGDGRESELREEESEKRGFGNAGAGNNEWLQADNAETGVIANTDNNGPHGPENGQGMGERNDRNKEGKDETREFEGCSFSDAGVTSNTTSNENNGRRQGGLHTKFAGIDGERDAADTCDKGLQRSNVNGSVGSFGSKSNKQPFRLFPSTWHNFPTQPPICRGNDGISVELVRAYVVEHLGAACSEKEINKITSETISQYRKEQIKAYGNAIVPEIAVQIFKAINEYESIQ